MHLFIICHGRQMCKKYFAEQAKKNRKVAETLQAASLFEILLCPVAQSRDIMAEITLLTGAVSTCSICPAS